MNAPHRAAERPYSGIYVCLGLFPPAEAKRLLARAYWMMRRRVKARGVR
jgi:hypothetical protein